MRETVTREGHQIFIDALTRFAERAGDPRMSRDQPTSSAAPLGLRFGGATAWAARRWRRRWPPPGCRRRRAPTAAEVDVVVVAEALKPEDRAMLERRSDACGAEQGGPGRFRRGRADGRAPTAGPPGSSALTGVPTVPMVGLLAVAALDDDLVAALRMLVRRARRPDVHRRIRWRPGTACRTSVRNGCWTRSTCSASPTASSRCSRAPRPPRCLRCCARLSGSTACWHGWPRSARRRGTGGCARRWPIACDGGDRRRQAWPSSWPTTTPCSP